MSLVHTAVRPDMCYDAGSYDWNSEKNTAPEDKDREEDLEFEQAAQVRDEIDILRRDSLDLPINRVTN